MAVLMMMVAETALDKVGFENAIILDQVDAMDCPPST